MSFVKVLISRNNETLSLSEGLGKREMNSPPLEQDPVTSPVQPREQDPVTSPVQPREQDPVTSPVQLREQDPVTSPVQPREQTFTVKVCSLSLCHYVYHTLTPSHSPRLPGRQSPVRAGQAEPGPSQSLEATQLLCELYIPFHW